MPRLFKTSNKSQVSLDKIADSRDNTQGQSTSGREVSPNRESVAYQSQYQQQTYNQGSPIYHQHTTTPATQQQQHYNDERYYNEAPTNQYTISSQAASEPPTGHPVQALGRSTSSRLSTAGPVNAYSEQQQQQQPLQNSRPTISLVNPNLQQERIAEDDQEANRSQYSQGSANRASVIGKDEKKSGRSGFRGLFSSKDKKEGKDSPVDPTRLSRHSSLLKKAPGQSQPTSPQQPQQSFQQSQRPGQSSQSISAHLQNQQEPSEDPNDERYYQYRQTDGQHELQSQEQRRPSVVDYEEDTTHYPAPLPKPAPYQQQNYAQHNVSQPQLDQPHKEEREHHSLHSIKDRLFHHHHPDELRPPSQNSLGPPSPLGGPPSQLVQQSQQQRTSTQEPARYSAQSVQAYQIAQQAVNQEVSQQPQPSSARESPQLPEEMVNRDRERQRDSRMDEQDPRYIAPQDPRVRMNSAQEQGRSTPPPTARGGRDDVQTLDHQQLVQKYEELQAKYSKVKRYYFDREAQVTQLQNTVANQRLSMSKTSLDDAQYATGFERLNGAIQNLAFNIRKEWRFVPNWLTPACNRDACAVGTKEMTAVGRACISRWLYEHIFQTIFHPGIDPALSAQLKNMERTLRRTPNILTEEQRDDLLTKVTTWRLTTCEGLQDVLHSRQYESNMEYLGQSLTDQLCTYLRNLLKDPAPPGLDGYLLPIITQTLIICANMPLESRDICIEYYFPGTLINETFMKIEPGMTPLVDPGFAPSHEDLFDEADMNDEDSSRGSKDNEVNVEEAIREAVKGGTSANNTLTSGGKKDKKSGLFSGGFGGGLVNKKTATGQGSTRGPGQIESKESNTHAKMEQDDRAWNIDKMTHGSKEGKVRFAVFFAVEVRGKSIKNDLENNGTKPQTQNGNGSSANAGVASNSGTSGSAGTAGVNVLVKAPVFGF